MLIPSIFILQVFDGALTTRSSETLVTITLVALLALALGYFADSTRARALSRAGRALDHLLSPIELENSLRSAAAATGGREWAALRDIGLLRSFFNSDGALALLDMLWLPIYLLTITWMHPLLGAIAALGVAVLVGVVVAADLLTRRQAGAALHNRRAAAEHVQQLLRSAEVIVAMGMTEAAIAGERERNDHLQLPQDELNRRATRMSALARMVSPMLQVVMLGCAAWLVSGARTSVGVMIASTLLLSRALQPLEQLLVGWQALSDARGAWSRLRRRTASIVVPHVTPPAPTGKVELERVAYVLSPGRPAFLKGVNLQLEAGELALVKALAQLKQRGTTVIMLGQRTSLLEHVDKLAILRDGALQVLDRSDPRSTHASATVIPLHRATPSYPSPAVT